MLGISCIILRVVIKGVGRGLLTLFIVIVTFARTDGEPAVGAGKDTAPEAAAARASCHTDDAVLRFLIYWYKISGTK